MENKYIKLNNLYKNRKLKKAVELGKDLLNKKLFLKEKGEILKIIGTSLDQLAVSENNKIKRKNIQKEALKYFNRLKRIDKFKAYRGIALIYHHQYNFKKAIEYYKKAFEINSENEMIYNDLGNAYQRAWILEKNHHNFDKAISFYNQALKKSKDRTLKISPLINLAIINDKAENNKDAKKYAEKALKMIKETKNPVYQSFTKHLQEIIDKNNK